VLQELNNSAHTNNLQPGVSRHKRLQQLDVTIGCSAQVTSVIRANVRRLVSSVVRHTGTGPIVGDVSKVRAAFIFKVRLPDYKHERNLAE
jgi:hypothetical protein